MVSGDELQIPRCDTCNLSLTDTPVSSTDAAAAWQLHQETEHNDATFFSNRPYPAITYPGEKSLLATYLTEPKQPISPFFTPEDWGQVTPVAESDKPPKPNGRHQMKKRGV